MNLADLVEKYAVDGVVDWTSVGHDDLYEYLDSNRVGLKTLFDQGVLHDQHWAQEVIRRSKQDLEWLAGYMVHETNPETAGQPISANLLRKENHGPFFDFFVKKDDSKPLSQQSEIKNRLLLYPRGSFKSTTGLADLVQWILNFPEIRILILTAADNLAVSFLDELKGHFLMKLQEPSLMNLFFPQFCLLEKDLTNAFEYQCPVWLAKGIKRREPTIMASSITSTLSGYHYEILHCDDTVSNRNSENEEQCLKVNKNFKINKKMLRPFGYCTKIGTRYHDSDMYGLEIDSTVGTTTSGPGWEMIESKASNSLILIGRAITVRQEVRSELLAKSINPNLFYQEAGADGCVLLMPKVLSYDYLLSEYNRDRFGQRGDEEGSFEGQMNQNPIPEAEAVFDLPMLLRATVPHVEIPFQGLVSHTWDFAFSGKKYRDFTTGCSVIWGPNGCAYVNDLVRDRFPNPIALAKAIVDMAVKHHPFVIGVEDAGASKFIEPTIIAEAQKTNDPLVIAVCSRIDWIPVTREDGAKKARMAALQPLLVGNLLKFVNYLPFLKTLYEEFLRCQVNLRRHNDIPDVISQQPRYAPRVLKQIQESGIASWTWTPEQKQAFRMRAAYNMYMEEATDPWGQPSFEPVVSLDDAKNNESDGYTPPANGLDPILGTMVG